MSIIIFSDPFPKGVYGEFDAGKIAGSPDEFSMQNVSYGRDDGEIDFIRKELPEALVNQAEKAMMHFGIPDGAKVSVGGVPYRISRNGFSLFGIAVADLTKAKELLQGKVVKIGDKMRSWERKGSLHFPDDANFAAICHCGHYAMAPKFGERGFGYGPYMGFSFSAYPLDRCPDNNELKQIVRYRAGELGIRLSSA